MPAQAPGANPWTGAIQGASVFDHPLRAALKKVLSVTGLDDPSNQVMGILAGVETPGAAAGGVVGKGLAAVRGALKRRVANPIKAYHGSPHDFDAFSMEKIGTGEGAQAYGHGLYFAESPEVAKTYKSAGPAANQHYDAINARLSALSKQMDALSPNGYRQWRDVEAGESLAAEYDRLLESKRDVGRMYEVNIHADPETLLDWDAPLRQQPRAVQDLGRKVLDGEIHPDRWDATPGREIYRRLNGRPERFLPPQQLVETPRGPRLSPDLTAEEVLKRRGVPGIRYLDQGSRASGEGSRNYVIWDDSLIDIAKKYGVAFAAAVGVMRARQQGASPTPAQGSTR